MEESEDGQESILEQSARLLRELSGLERRTVQLLNFAANAIEALAESTGNPEEAMQKFQKNAGAYYGLLLEQSRFIREKIDELLALGIMPHVAGQTPIPFNLAKQEDKLKEKAQSLSNIKHQLDHLASTWESAAGGNSS